MLQEFVQEVKNLISQNTDAMHTVFPGKIIAYHTDTGLADIQPVMKYKKPDGTTMDYPQITGVPVVFPRSNAQKAVIAYPIKPDDGCLVLISEQSIDYWLYGQETDTKLAFDLTNAICIVGMFTPANSVLKEACDEDAIIIDVEGTRIKTKKDLVQIDAKTVTVNATDVNINATNVNVNAAVMNITAADTYINGNLTVSGGVINLN